jgi:hypothetical protein
MFGNLIKMGKGWHGIFFYLLRTARGKKGTRSMVRGYKAKFVKRFLKGSLERHPDILWIRVVLKSTSGMFKCVTTKCSLQV